MRSVGNVSPHPNLNDQVEVAPAQGPSFDDQLKEQKLLYWKRKVEAKERKIMERDERIALARDKRRAMAKKFFPEEPLPPPYHPPNNDDDDDIFGGPMN